MNLSSEKIADNIYAIANEGDYYIYAPLAGMFVQCDASDFSVMQAALQGRNVDCGIAEIAAELKKNEFHKTELCSSPREYAKMSVLANYKCNLSCSYCYSAQGRSRKEISPLHLNAALDFFLMNAKPDECRSLFFSGGGEPLLSWPIIRPALERALSLARGKGIVLEVHFMTNGTIYNKNISDFLRSNGCTLCFSYEILERIQNSTRGHYSLVSENIRRYLDDGNTVLVSSTITPESVECLKEMVDSLATRFPEIETVTMEPATGSDLYGSPGELAEFYDSFDRNFRDAVETASKHGISLHTSIEDLTDNYVDRYCPGKLCLTPMGTFTICHCASSPQEARYERCRYGHIDEEGTVCFDEDKFRTLIKTNCNSYKECDDCFASVHCGGECLTRRDTYPPEFIAEVCRHIRNNAFKELKTALEEDE